MIDLRPATADEMVLAFLQADMETPTERGNEFAAALARTGVDRALLIGTDADSNNPQQNNIRRCVLGAVRGYGWGQYLFMDFPNDTAWRLVRVTPTEVSGFKYVNHQEGWARVSGSTRLVADGVRNLDHVQNREIKGNVSAIAARLRQGDRFPALIAVQSIGAADVVLLEGHTRATAYALTGLPNEVEVFVGTSAHMAGWAFF
jgi:hypothetical protein